jgi:hypothetical protein
MHEVKATTLVKCTRLAGYSAENSLVSGRPDYQSVSRFKVPIVVSDSISRKRINDSGD